MPAFYWDACIFIAFLNDNRPAYGQSIDHIGQFLDEAKRRECTIFTSTLTIAEISAKHLLNSNYGSFSDFLADYTGIIQQVSADPNVMLLASALRGLTYTKTGGKRDLATPDAVHLASALALQSNYGVTLDAFHTFDDGKGKGPGGKSISLLSFETWCEACADDPIARRVIAMKRSRPDHPNPRLPLDAPPPPEPPSTEEDDEDDEDIDPAEDGDADL
jgi:hypothetical protein